MDPLPALAALGLPMALTACSGGAEALAPSPSFTPALAVVAGDRQTATVARELSAAIAVRLTDAKRLAPLPQVLVNWVVVSGGGSVFAGAAMTDAQGMARERWTLGPIAGEQTLEARAVDSTGAPIVFARATASAVPDVATVFDLAGPYRREGSRYVPVDRITAGDSFFVAVIYGDQFGNLTWVRGDGGSPDRVAWSAIGPNAVQPIGPIAGDASGIGWQEFAHAGAGGTVITVQATSACVPGVVASRLIPVEQAS